MGTGGDNDIGFRNIYAAARQPLGPHGTVVGVAFGRHIVKKRQTRRLAHHMGKGRIEFIRGINRRWGGMAEVSEL
jgi:hypothetical protein